MIYDTQKLSSHCRPIHKSKSPRSRKYTYSSFSSTMRYTLFSIFICRMCVQLRGERTGSVRLPLATRHRLYRDGQEHHGVLRHQRSWHSAAAASAAAQVRDWAALHQQHPGQLLSRPKPACPCHRPRRPSLVLLYLLIN